ncbi:MAG TPA: LysM peptidoglycan-binding domain-containing protein [Phycisphaerales bacterium]|nr:LysM peptidoglycan-binding domain-containing protein [Phycisphaerales bacterium]
MALPSQTDHNSENSRSVTGQAGNTNTTKILLVVAGITLLGGGVYALSNLNKQQKTDATKTKEIATNAGTPTGTTPAPTEPTAITTPAPGTNTVPFTNQPAGTTATPTTVVRSDVNNTPAPTTPAGTAGATTPAPGTAPSTTPALNTPPGTTPATTTPGTTTTTPAPTSLTTNLTVLQLIQQGDSAMANNKMVEARQAFSRALLDRDASEADKATLRTKLTTINQELVFGPRVEATDGLVESYKVQSGDSLVKIARKRELATDWRFIQRVNRISNPNALRAGQTLKLVKGPFHAVVNKSAYRADIFAGAPDDPANWLFIKSYTLGLGEGNSTPVGNYVVKKGSKLIDPPWVNPRTGEKFASNDPKNPIGEHWIGWQGVGDSTANQGYGFHGTIDPNSIGQQKSMGCARMKADDVAELYELLVEEVSVVRVLP